MHTSFGFLTLFTNYFSMKCEFAANIFDALQTDFCCSITLTKFYLSLFEFFVQTNWTVELDSVGKKKLSNI